MKNFAVWVLVFFCSTSLWGANDPSQTQSCGCHKIVAMRAAAFPDIKQSKTVVPLLLPQQREQYRQHVLTTAPSNLITVLAQHIEDGICADNITDELTIAAIAYVFLTTPYPSRTVQEGFDAFVIGAHNSTE